MNNNDILTAYRDRRRAEQMRDRAKEQAKQAHAEFARFDEALKLASIVTNVHKGIALRIEGEWVNRLDDVDRSAQVIALVGSRSGTFRVAVRERSKRSERDFTERAEAFSYAMDFVTGS